MDILEKGGELGGWLELDIFENAEMQAKNIVKQHIRIHNKMTNVSLAVISGLVFNTGSQIAFSYGALGTSSTAVSASSTTLGAEISTGGLQRISGTPSRTTTTQTNDTAVLTLSWTSSGTNTIQEFGIFNASSVGVMLARVLTGTIPVTTGNVVAGSYSWQVVGN